MVADDSERFELLYRRHFRAVLRYALARLDPERAKGATAETFLIAWRRLDDVPPDPRAWLFGVARKVVAGQLRSAGRQQALAEQVARCGQQDLAADPADAVTERHAALTALARLRDSDRELLMLVAWDGLSGADAARALGLTRLAFAVRLHRARRRLAAALAAAGTGPPGPAANLSQFLQTSPHPAGRHADVRSN